MATLLLAGDVFAMTQRSLKSLWIAALLSLSASGCVLYGGGGDYTDSGYGYPGNVTFRWTLAGASCSNAPEVRGVRISIPGEYLANDGFYPCRAGGFDGVELHDFGGGAYTYTVDAVGYSGDVIYTAAGSFTVDGDVRLSVDLAPFGRPASYAYLSWTFPASAGMTSPNCEQAGVVTVDVSIDGASPVSYNCHEGFGVAQVQSEYLDSGSHDIVLTARDDAGYPYYAYRGTLQTFSNAPISGDYSLQWAVGGVALEWSLISSGMVQPCGAAGIQNLNINFEDSKGNLVYGFAGDVHACDSAPVVYNYLLPGTYKVVLQGTGPGGTYVSDRSRPVMVTVREGRFVTEAEAVTVPMYRR